MKIILGILIISFLHSCEKKFNKTESGIEYRFIQKNSQTKKINPGDIVELNMKYTNERDSVLYDTYELMSPFRIRVSENILPGTIDEALNLMNEEDSAIFKLDAEKFFVETKKEEIPAYIKPGEKLIFYIKVKKVISFSEFLEEKKKIHIENEKEEEQMIKHYLMISNINVEPTPSGLYYIEKKKGTGKPVSDTSLVSIHYFLSILNGEIIDNTYQRGEPFIFQLGKEIVIPGLEEGIKYMREGGEATLIIPSKLAYGDKQYKKIPPYSTLVFEIKLVKVFY